MKHFSFTLSFSQCILLLLNRVPRMVLIWFTILPSRHTFDWQFLAVKYHAFCICVHHTTKLYWPYMVIKHPVKLVPTIYNPFFVESLVRPNDFHFNFSRMQKVVYAYLKKDCYIALTVTIKYAHYSNNINSFITKKKYKNSKCRNCNLS